MGINLANKITLLRILLIPIFIIFMLRESHYWAMIIFGIAAATDGLDGFIARHFKQKTVLGSILDPLADKLLLTTAFIGMMVHYEHLVWLLVLIVSRDIILCIGTLLIYLSGAKFEFQPNIFGKITTFAQIIMVILVLSSAGLNHQEFLKSNYFIFWAYITVGLTVISGYSYVSRGMICLLEQTTKPS